MSETTSYEEKSLLLQIADGDEHAFQILYHQYRKKITSFAYLLTESADMADEIVQEVFVKIWINRHKLQEVVSFNAWLHTVTRNLVVDAMKKISRENTRNAAWAKTITLEDNYADEIILSRENEKLLQAAVQQLTQQQKQVYQLSQDSGMKNEEIASLLNISPLTVKNHLTAARKSIRDHFRRNADLIIVILLVNSSL